MPEPGTCQIRRTKPLGPMKGCEDLECFKECVRLIRSERERDKRGY